MKNVVYSPLGDILSGWVMDAGAGGAGSIFQDAQHDAGENSGVGPLPADINMVEPPSHHELLATTACGTNSSQQSNSNPTIGLISYQ